MAEEGIFQGINWRVGVPNGDFVDLRGRTTATTFGGKTSSRRCRLLIRPLMEAGSATVVTGVLEKVLVPLDDVARLRALPIVRL
jgi:hypothetical protein